MPSKGKLFSWCGVCCPKRNNFRLVLTTVVLWSLVFAFFKSFFLRPSELPTTESNNYDIARIQSEILRKSTLTGMNIKHWYTTVYFKTNLRSQKRSSVANIVTKYCRSVQWRGCKYSKKGSLVLRVTRGFGFNKILWP